MLYGHSRGDLGVRCWQGRGGCLVTGKKRSISIVGLQLVRPMFCLSATHKSQSLLFVMQTRLLRSRTCMRFLLHLSLRQTSDLNSTQSHAILSEGQGPVAFQGMVLDECDWPQPQMPPLNMLRGVQTNSMGDICNSQQMSSKCPPREHRWMC